MEGSNSQQEQMRKMKYMSLPLYMGLVQTCEHGVRPSPYLLGQNKCRIEMGGDLCGVPCPIVVAL